MRLFGVIKSLARIDGILAVFNLVPVFACWMGEKLDFQAKTGAGGQEFEMTIPLVSGQGGASHARQ